MTNDTKLLVAFDFDHTVVDGNTDTWITKAAPGGDIPTALKDSYVTGHWTQYMGRVLQHLHSEGVDASALQGVLQDLPYTAGMEQLFQHLAQCAAHCIILSDSNTQFIEWILQDRGHSSLFSKVYTNPASVSDQGQLLLGPYHSHSCATCPANMCKRLILQLHMQQHVLRSQAPYCRVAYVGDGSNDLCPAQSLGPTDIVFVRAGFALDKLLQKPEIAGSVQAEIVRWQTGHDILQRLQAL
ncbi:hypothetical protein OEZ86_010892 [Tetradesmus obliquus]|nr:hypothetical protein OEZ86_010892 [Tetradesmus obliquus]